MSYKVILFIRENIASVDNIIDNNNKRKNLVERFNTSKITLYRIYTNGLEIDDFENSYLSIKDSLNDTDTIFFVDEKAISGYNNTQLEDIFVKINNLLVNNVDIFYLANAQDNWQIKTRYSNLDEYLGLIFYKSESPSSLYCIASIKSKMNNILNNLKNVNNIKVSARLNNLIETNVLSAATTYPRLFSPNIDMISRNKELYNLNPLKLNLDYSQQPINKGDTTFFYFVVGLFILCIIFWLMTKIYPHCI